MIIDNSYINEALFVHAGNWETPIVDMQIKTITFSNGYGAVVEKQTEETFNIYPSYMGFAEYNIFHDENIINISAEEVETLLISLARGY